MKPAGLTLINVLTPEQLGLLQRVDTPTVANVIELFKVRSFVAGFSNQTLKAVYPELPPAVGYAVTATFRSAFPAEAGDNYAGMPQLIDHAVSIPVPRIVVFQDLDEPPKAATYGEVMVTSFQRFGFAGLITSGGARDIEQVRRLRFPCWATSVIVSHGYCRFPDINLPINVAGLFVKPGDLLHADANGVVQIPHAIAGRVAELCEPFMEAEQIILDYLGSPAATAEGYREAVGRAKRRIAELSEQAQAWTKRRDE